MQSGGIRSIFRNSAQLSAAQVIGVLTRLAMVVIVTRELGADLYGLLAYSQAWSASFFSLATAGIGAALVLEINRRREAATRIAAEALGLQLLLTLVAAALSVAGALLVTPDPRAPALIFILALALAGRSVVSWTTQVHTARETTHHVMRQEVVFRTVELAAVTAILAAGGGVLALAWVAAAAWLLQAGWAVSVLHRKVLPVGIAADGAAWKALLVLAAPFFIMMLSAEWRSYGALILFRNTVPDAQAFAQLALGFQAAFIAAILPLSLSAAVQPALVRSCARGDGRDLAWGDVVQRWSVVLGAAVALVAMAFGRDLFRLVFGEEFAEAGSIAAMALWWYAGMLAGAGYAQVLIARGHTRIVAASSIAGAVAMTLLLPPLAARYGVDGALAAMNVSYALPPLVVLAAAVRHGWTGWMRGLIRPLCAVLPGTAAFLLLRPQGAIVALAVALAALVAGCLVFRAVSPGDARGLPMASHAG